MRSRFKHPRGMWTVRSWPSRSSVLAFVLAIALLIGLQRAAPLQADPLRTEKGWRGAGPQPCRGIDGGILPCRSGSNLIAVRADRMFDAQSGRLLPDQRIVIRGERIEIVGPAGEVPVPAGAKSIDLGDATVLPGLIDAHTHMFNPSKASVPESMAVLVALQNLQQTLRAGFTSVRDLGSHGHGYNDVVVRDAVAAGWLEGPRIQVATRTIFWSGSPYADANDVLAPAVVDDEAAIRQAVRDQVARGADWIKLYPTSATYAFQANGELEFVPTLPTELLAAAISQAHALGRPVACHAFGGEGLNAAIERGCDTIEHGMGLTRAQAVTMAARGIFLAPTLARYTEPYLDDADDVATKGKHRLSERFSQTLKVIREVPGLKLMLGSGADGVTFAHGTQAIELEALVVRGGFAPAVVLQSATLTNATGLGWAADVGSIEPGKFADLIAVRGNPLADITELQRLFFVMKGGHVVRDERAEHL